VAGFLEREVELVPGKQTLRAALGKPLEWHEYRVIDETGRCDQVGAVFFSARLDLGRAKELAERASGRVKDFIEYMEQHEKYRSEGNQMRNNYHSAARSFWLWGLRHGEPVAVAICKQGEVELPSLGGADWHAYPASGTGQFEARVDDASRTIRIASVTDFGELVATAPADWKTQAQVVRNMQLSRARNGMGGDATPDTAEIEKEAADALPWPTLSIVSLDGGRRYAEVVRLDVTKGNGEIKVTDLPPGKYRVWWSRRVHFVKDGRRVMETDLSSHGVEVIVTASGVSRVEVPIELR